MHLIGINGFKTSGKDTTYAIIKAFVENDSPELRVERRAFADNLKIMAGLALGFKGTDGQLVEYMDVLKETGSISTVMQNANRIISGRQYLQEFGANAREVFGDTFWVDQVVPAEAFEFHAVWETVGRKGRRADLPAIGCVTDVRYENEAERIQIMSGKVWEVIRPGIESDGHSSEKPLPRHLVDRQIINDGTIQDLEGRIEEALNDLE